MNRGGAIEVESLKFATTVKFSLGGTDMVTEVDPIFAKSVASSITEEMVTKWTGKQEKIDDLDSIRNGAEKGATAVQDIKTINGQSLVGKGDIVIKGADAGNVVDLMIFIGQSNMAGRGIVTDEYPEAAPAVPDGYGYEFRAISDPSKLYPIVEPFGVNENNTESGVSEPGRKTGSMVSAFANAYFEYTGIPIVGVSCSKGGTSLDFWKVGGAPLNDAISRHDAAKSWLTQNGYTIRRDYMVWCQGESDAANGTSNDEYTDGLESIVAEMTSHGIEKCLLVRIGRYIGEEKNYDGMISLQTEICKNSDDIVMISNDFATMTGLLKDEQHYVQKGYNIAGRHAGMHAAFYASTGIKPSLYDKFYGNIFVPFPPNMGGVVVDSELSATSQNPVQNKTIAEALAKISRTLDTYGVRLDALESSSPVEYCDVAYNLTNVDISQSASVAVKGKPFTATLTIGYMYAMESIKVEMGGVDITAESLTGMDINIAEVTGDIVITAVASAVTTLFDMNFAEKSLEEYIDEGLVTRNGTISSTHSTEGDLFSIVDTANLVLTDSLTFPNDFEIYLRMKTSDFDNSIDDTGLGGLSIFNKNGARPMINLRAPNTGTASPHTEGLALQSRLVSSSGDNYTITDKTVPLNDGKFHDVIIRYEGTSVSMIVDGISSASATTGRTSNTVTHLLGYRNNYNFNRVLLARLAVYAI